MFCLPCSSATKQGAGGSPRHARAASSAAGGAPYHDHTKHRQQPPACTTAHHLPRKVPGRNHQPVTRALLPLLVLLLLVVLLCAVLVGGARVVAHVDCNQMGILSYALPPTPLAPAARALLQLLLAG